MKKIILLTFCLFAFAAAVMAADPAPSASAAPAAAPEPAPMLPEPEPAKLYPKWKHAGIFSWSYTQNTISKNWSGKEMYKRSWQAMLDISLERDTENTEWTATFKESYGETDTSSEHVLSADRIEFNTVFTYKIYRHLQPYASFYTLSQHNKFWDPVTYVESAGLNLTFIDNSIHSLKVRTGAALRQTDSDQNGNTRNAGAEGVLNYIFVFQESLKFTSDFRAYETFRKEDGEIISWDNKLFLKTGPWLTTTIGYIAYYDKSRLTRHHWPDDIETMVYVSLGVSVNLFKV